MTAGAWTTRSVAARLMVALALALAVALSGCATSTVSPSASAGAQPSGMTAASATALPATEGPRAELVLGCWSIEPAECRFVAERILATLPPERGPAFAVELQLVPCENPAVPCPESLAARQGKAVIEFLDRGEPIELSVSGPPQGPEFAVLDAFYLGLTNPSSARVGGPGPFPFEIGHCGISHVIDFDGSFWLPRGQVDGDSPTVINAESGTIRLVGPNIAEFRGDSGFVVQLARFPGPKHFWGCD